MHISEGMTYDESKNIWTVEFIPFIEVRFRLDFHTREIHWAVIHLLSFRSGPF